MLSSPRVSAGVPSRTASRRLFRSEVVPPCGYFFSSPGRHLDVADRAEPAAALRPPGDVLAIGPEHAFLALDPQREAEAVRQQRAEVLHVHVAEVDQRLGVGAVPVVGPGRVPDLHGDAGRAAPRRSAQAVEVVDRDLLELRIVDRGEPGPLGVARHVAPVDQGRVVERAEETVLAAACGPSARPGRSGSSRRRSPACRAPGRAPARAAPRRRWCRRASRP